jgi:hypothetical protein
MGLACDVTNQSQDLLLGSLGITLVQAVNKESNRHRVPEIFTRFNDEFLELN